MLSPNSTTLFAGALVYVKDGDQRGTHVGHPVTYNGIYTTVALVWPGLDSQFEASSEVFSFGFKLI